MMATDLVPDRDALQRNVFDDAESIIASMGPEIGILQASEITDASGYTEPPGVPEQQCVEKDVCIVRANAEREAHDTKVTPHQQIAERKCDLSLRQAQLKAETDKTQTDTDSVGPIVRAVKGREIAITRQEAVEAKTVPTECELDSTVHKPAGVVHYQRKQEVQASKIEALLRVQVDAECIRLDAKAQAQATMAHAEAEVKATATRTRAKAEAIAVRGQAEADTIRTADEAGVKAMSDKADALVEYGEVVAYQMLLDKAPEIVRTLNEPLASMCDLSIISTGDASALLKAMTNNAERLDLTLCSLVSAGLTDMVGSHLPGSDVSTDCAGSADRSGTAPAAIAKRPEH